MREEPASAAAADVQVPVVADAVHRARGGGRRGPRRRARRVGDGDGSHGGHGRRVRETSARRPRQGGGGTRAASRDHAAGRERGPAAAPTLLPRGRMGLGGGRVRVHGPPAQPRVATVVRRAREGRGAQVPGRRVLQHRSVQRGDGL